MDELLKRLIEEQKIEASLRPEPTVQALQAAFERGYLHIKFPGTRGGTELGVTVDRERSDVSGADFAAGTGTVRIVGHLVLNYTRVLLHGTLDLADLKGTGRLEPVEDI